MQLPTDLAFPRFPRCSVLLLSLALAACGQQGGSNDDPSIALLGGGTHSEAEVDILWVASGSEGLSTPRDLGFHPDHDAKIYVVSHDQNGVTIIDDADSDDASAQFVTSFGSDHFTIDPSSIAFAANGFFATVHETDELTQGPPPWGTPEDFMGPTLWDANVDDFDAGHTSHMDMLHNSPNAMGVAWESGNAYWVFDGYHSSITRYDFKEDHGPGGTDHADGEVMRYVEGEVDRKPDVPSHMELDRETDLLYIADTGNKRIAVLDITTGSAGGDLTPNYDTSQGSGFQIEVDDAEISTLVDGEEHSMTRPSGLALRDGVVYVSDNKRSKIMGYDAESGELIDYLEMDLPEGSLMGIEFDAEGNLWFADAVGDRIGRISPKSE